MATILSSVAFMGATACGGAPAPEPERPDFWTSAQNILVGGFVAPAPADYYDGGNESFITVERYRELKNAGFDFIVGHAEKGFKSPDVLNALECAKEAGVKYVINSDIMNFYNSTPERIKQTIGSSIEHEGCMGAFAVDEPQATRYKNIGALWDRFSKATDKKLLINLLPLIMPDEFPMYNVTTYQELYSAVTYEQYLQSYCDYVKNDFISIDIYPFYQKEVGGSMTYSMYVPWLRNLEIAETVAVRNGREHWQCVQGQQVHSFSKKPDYYDVRMQIYTSMAYGVQTFEYYCYFTPQEVERPCLIDKQGNQTSIYHAAKRVNDEIHAFGDVFVQYVSGWQGVMPVGSCPEFDLLQTPLKTCDRIEVQASQNALVGVFRDKQGKDAYMTTNFTVPGDGLSNRVTMKIKDAEKAVCYIGGVRTEKALENGVLTLDLGPGEGVFVIPE